MFLDSLVLIFPQLILYLPQCKFNLIQFKFLAPLKRYLFFFFIRQESFANMWMTLLELLICSSLTYTCQGSQYKEEQQVVEKCYNSWINPHSNRQIIWGY